MMSFLLYSCSKLTVWSLMRKSWHPLVSPLCLLVQPPVLLFLLAVTHQFLYIGKILLLVIHGTAAHVKESESVCVCLCECSWIRPVGSGSPMGKSEQQKSMSNCLLQQPLLLRATSSKSLHLRCSCGLWSCLYRAAFVWCSIRMNRKKTGAVKQRAYWSTYSTVVWLTTHFS